MKNPSICSHTSVTQQNALRSALVALVFTCIGTAGFADDWTFSLKQPGAPKAEGPFVFKDDTAITLLTKEFTISESDRDKKTFKLKMSENGSVYGPFELKNSGRVQIGNTAFVIEGLFIPGLKLSVSYKSGMAGNKGILDELIGILGPCGTAQIDLEPHPEIEFYRGVTYLQKLEEAGQGFGMKKMTSGSSVNLPGFPANSFQYYQ
jgi:hypothetical protein